MKPEERCSRQATRDRRTAEGHGRKVVQFFDEAARRQQLPGLDDVVLDPAVRDRLRPDQRIPVAAQVRYRLVGVCRDREADEVDQVAEVEIAARQRPLGRRHRPGDRGPRLLDKDLAAKRDAAVSGRHEGAPEIHRGAEEIERPQQAIGLEVVNHGGGDLLERRAVGVLKAVAEKHHVGRRFRQGRSGPSAAYHDRGLREGRIVAPGPADLQRRGSRAAAELGRQRRRDGDRRAAGNVAGRDDELSVEVDMVGRLGAPGHAMVLGQIAHRVVVEQCPHREPIAGALRRGARGGGRPDRQRAWRQRDRRDRRVQVDADRLPHRVATGIVGGGHLDDEIVLG